MLLMLQIIEAFIFFLSAIFWIMSSWVDPFEQTYSKYESFLVSFLKNWFIFRNFKFIPCQRRNAILQYIEGKSFNSINLSAYKMKYLSEANMWAAFFAGVGAVVHIIYVMFGNPPVK